MVGARQTLYVDESGHAGINYLDDRQPFHVAAAVLVSDTDRERLASVIKKHGRPGIELKGSKLLQTARGRRTAISLIRDLASAGIVPFFVLMDRRFSIAGKIVDVFLDPFHQDAVDWLPTSAIKQRKQITEILSDLLDAESLEAFANAYRAPSSSAFAAVLASIIRQVREHGDVRLTRAFEGAAKAVETITAAETYGNAAGRHVDWAALNLPALCHLIRLVDRTLDGHGRFSIVHDENEQFRELFCHVIATFTRPGAKQPDWKLPDGTLFRAVFTNVTDFRMEKSENDLLLQAADVIAAAVARVARVATSAYERLERDMKELAAMTMPALLYDDDDPRPQLAAAYAHDRTIASLIMAAMPSHSLRK